MKQKMHKIGKIAVVEDIDDLEKSMYRFLESINDEINDLEKKYSSITVQTVSHDAVVMNGEVVCTAIIIYNYE